MPAKSSIGTVVLAALIAAPGCGSGDRANPDDPPASKPGAADKNRLSALPESGVKWESSLSASAAALGAPTFGDHRLTEEQQRLYTMIPGSHVEKFKRYVRDQIGLEIPEGCGSFVGRAGNYRSWYEGRGKSNPERVAPDDYEQNTVAFMMPLEEVPGFVERLKACGERFEERSPKIEFSWTSWEVERPPEIMSFRWGVSGYTVMFFPSTGAGEREWTYGFNIAPDVGLVCYHSEFVADDE